MIAPATAIENWQREVSEWCPALRVEIYHGSAKEREEIRAKLLVDGKANFDVLITTYNMVTRKGDRVKFFKKMNFSYIVLGNFRTNER